MLKKKNKKLLIISGIAFLFFFMVVILKENATCLLGESAYLQFRLAPGNITVPYQRKIKWQPHSAFADSIYNLWANRAIPVNNLNGKGDVPRILLAKLLVQRDIAEVNSTILNLKVWGSTGSSWALNRKGDYDFNLTILTTILWMYGDKENLLYPQSKQYLLHTLLSEEGGDFRYAAPHTLGWVAETENHILMTEGCRYLKNRWLALHGKTDKRFDNIQNGMENKLLNYINAMLINGLYEFNSLPYTGYTITALLNLEAFGSEKIQTSSRNLLDYMNWCYALGSYRLKHFPPMRRRYEKENIKLLTTDYHSIFMKSWLSYSSFSNYDKDITNGHPHALMGCCMPYRPADSAMAFLFKKGSGYFVKLGHGSGACPEIYTAGKHYLLSAGGANQGKRSLIVTRPVTLFLNDTAKQLSSVIHLSGPGTDFMHWNNTGVYKNFACAAGPVFIPKGFEAVAQKGNWSVFALKDSVMAVIYSTHSLGIIVVFENNLSAQALLDTLIKANPDALNLQNAFRFPDGQNITYEVKAPVNKWVIVAENGRQVNRNFQKWPLIEGHFNNQPDSVQHDFIW